MHPTANQRECHRKLAASHVECAASDAGLEPVEENSILIPPKIHYCWFGSDGQNALLKKCMASWQRIMPDYELKEWNETNSPLDNNYTRAAYRQKAWSRLSNYIRLHALYTEGGIYLDTDVELLRSLSPLQQHKCFTGFQQEEQHTDWVNNAIMGAEPGHEFLRRCMELTLELYEAEGEFYRGPAIATAVLREMGLDAYGLQEIGDVTVYPAEYFYPYPWFGKFSPECITENTYCIHYWAASWVKPEARQKQKKLSPSQFIGRLKRVLSRRL